MLLRHRLLDKFEVATRLLAASHHFLLITSICAFASSWDNWTHECEGSVCVFLYNWFFFFLFSFLFLVVIDFFGRWYSGVTFSYLIFSTFLRSVSLSLTSFYYVSIIIKYFNEKNLSFKSFPNYWIMKKKYYEYFCVPHL